MSSLRPIWISQLRVRASYSPKEALAAETDAPGSHQFFLSPHRKTTRVAILRIGRVNITTTRLRLARRSPRFICGRRVASGSSTTRAGGRETEECNHVMGTRDCRCVGKSIRRAAALLLPVLQTFADGFDETVRARAYCNGVPRRRGLADKPHPGTSMILYQQMFNVLVEHCHVHSMIRPP